MGNLQRELFVSPAYINRAYEDSALPIDCEQTISQPYTVAFMTSILNIKKNEKILEIGTGSGYQAALLVLLGCKVFTVERISGLYEKSNKIFKELNLNIVQRLADGSIGWQEFAPYDGIIITAAAPEIPQSMLKQLAFGGRMVVPVGDKESQTMFLIIKKSETEFEEYNYDRFRFVPLIGKAGWDSAQ